MVKFYQGVSGGMAPEDLKPVNRALLKAERRLGDNPRIPEPTIDFSADDTTVAQDVTVTFTPTIEGQWYDAQWSTFLTNGQVSIPPVGTFVTTPASPNASWQYKQDGTYDVMLTVTGPGGEIRTTKVGYVVVFTA